MELHNGHIYAGSFPVAVLLSTAPAGAVRDLEDAVERAHPEYLTLEHQSEIKSLEDEIESLEGDLRDARNDIEQAQGETAEVEGKLSSLYVDHDALKDAARALRARLSQAKCMDRQLATLCQELSDIVDPRPSIPEMVEECRREAVIEHRTVKDGNRIVRYEFTGRWRDTIVTAEAVRRDGGLFKLTFASDLAMPIDCRTGAECQSMFNLRINSLLVATERGDI